MPLLQDSRDYIVPKAPMPQQTITSTSLARAGPLKRCRSLNDTSVRTGIKKNRHSPRLDREHSSSWSKSAGGGELSHNKASRPASCSWPPSPSRLQEDPDLHPATPPSESLPALTAKALREIQRQSSESSFSLAEDNEWNFIMASRKPSIPPSPSARSPNDVTRSKKSSTVYNPGFKEHLEVGRIYDKEGTWVFPVNLDEIRQMLDRSRDSPAPDETAIMHYRALANDMDNEATVTHQLLRQILPIQAYEESATLKTLWHKRWNNVVPVVYASGKKIVPSPDVAVGLRRDTLSRATNNALLASAVHDYAMPAGYESNLAWVVLTVEAKGPGGDLATGWRQNQHNGAVAVRNLLRLKQCIGTEEAFLDTANVFSIFFDGRQLHINTHWATREEDGEISCYARPLYGWSLTSLNDAQFIEARQAVRNLFHYLNTTVQQQILNDLAVLQTIPPDHLKAFPTDNRTALKRKTSTKDDASEVNRGPTPSPSEISGARSMRPPPRKKNKTSSGLSESIPSPRSSKEGEGGGRRAA
ncbi:MAG: hypothetical protein M1817_001419 [Caeruleum heppii]|nr:MAG: hypothetical protein M1817_001419 [Caeruleum heppii]